MKIKKIKLKISNNLDSDGRVKFQIDKLHVFIDGAIAEEIYYYLLQVFVEYEVNTVMDSIEFRLDTSSIDSVMLSLHGLDMNVAVTKKEAALICNHLDELYDLTS